MYKFNPFTGTLDLVGSGGSGSFYLEIEEFIPIQGQTQFLSAALPKGKVIFIINGVQIPLIAIIVNVNIITYNPSKNEGYIIQSDDTIKINYLK